MPQQGWIKLHRKILEDELWIDCTPEQKVIMMTLLMLANHDDKSWIWQGKKFSIKAGQLITSIESIRKISGKNISSKNVRSALVKFKKYGFLANESAKTGRLITIANWAKYQGNDDEVAKQEAKRWQRGGKEVATNKNVKNVENINTRANSTLESDFEKLWKLYPKKIGKKAASAAYKRAMKRPKNPTTNKQIQDGIVAYKRIIANSGTDKQYIKDGSTFFNQEAWNDYLEVIREEQNGHEARKPKFDPRKVAIEMYLGYNSIDQVIEQINAEEIPIDPEDAKRYIAEYKEGENALD
nr:MAG TPA: replisome organizer protein [Caudoviricetes sp.]